MNNGLGNTWTEAVNICLEMQPYHLPAGTEESHENLVRIIHVLAKIRTSSSGMQIRSVIT